MLNISGVTDISMSLIRKIDMGEHPPMFYFKIDFRNEDGDRTTISVSMNQETGAAAYQQQGDQLEKTF